MDVQEVQRIVAQAQANREKLRQRLQPAADDVSPRRSPLKERNTSTPTTPRLSVKARVPEAGPDGTGSATGRSRSPLGRDVQPERRTTTTTTTTTVTEKEEKIHRTQSTTPNRTTPVHATPIVTSALRTVPDYDEEVFGASGRKKRLAALAQKFQHYRQDEDETLPSTPVVSTPKYSPPSDQDLNVTKEIDVDEELASIHATPTVPRLTGRLMPSGHSPTKNLAQDPDFVNSLKAQGFEETTSKSKLVYDFNKTDENRSRPTSPYKQRAPTFLSSPTRNATEPRPSSPHKPHPLQFVSPQVNRASLAKSPGPSARPPSPTKTPNPRPTSPYKPHPLQFVSPQHQAPPVPTPTSKADSVARPAKPTRTWAFSQFENMKEEEEKKTWKTETTVHVTPLRPVTKGPTENSDTASRRSISEKMNLFEHEAKPDPVSPAIDPAMMSMSDRRALFEKNRTAPKPIARFGDAVTPSMLSRGQDRHEARTEAKQLFTPRARSPIQMGVSPKRVASPVKAPSPKRIKDFVASSWDHAHRQQPPPLPATGPPVERSPSPPPKSPPPPPPKPPQMSPARSPIRLKSQYPGVDSLKKVKVSPPKPGQLYPQVGVESSSEDERPGTSMSEASSMAPSEAPSLGAAIRRAANVHRQLEEKRNPMPAISETPSPPKFRSPRAPDPSNFEHRHPQQHHDEDDEMSERSESVISGDIDDMLDEAMDDSYTTHGSRSPSPKRLQSRGSCSPSASAGSWEFATPQSQVKRGGQRDYRTPLVGQSLKSPEKLPEVEGADGSTLIHTVSFYRKQKPATPYQKIIRSSITIFEEGETESNPQENIQSEIRKLHEEAEEQRQRMEQASKALNYCVIQNEFEGSSERVEGERLLLEATHKYSAASSEIKRLSTLASIGQSSSPSKAGRTSSSSKGQISISGLALPLKPEFVKMLREVGDDTVHYFIVLVKHKSRVIPTQMLCTGEGISKGKLIFPNLINLRDLDFDFQIHIEVYGLQTRREHVPHDVKYHIRKDKSMFNLTPLKKMKKQESKAFPRNQNPVNSKTIRRPAFGMVGFSVINIQTLKNRAFHLEKVPAVSPLAGGLEMTLTIHSENRVEQRGFLTMFTDVHGYGDWCRRWVRLSGNGLHFWKYPEDESKGLEPTDQISLSLCTTDEVALAPKEVCSRLNTLMLETRRPWRQGDEDSLVMRVNRQSGVTSIRHLLSADTRDDRIGWCKILNRALENIRAWDPTAMRPRSESAASRGSSDSASTSTDIW
ncbi:anillin-like isoform X2 [Tigriopus californicus]|uniref:anillin-like isoform X2 n=1 Tax=Tigriopus californicus TaxID=6832 RepID=UPI0027D9F31C|nr:anillin-like isoform X2 [Tigriopus californicus]